MRVLLAEDESTSRQVLRAALERWGYEVVLALDGDQALEVLQAEDRPLIAIVNWFMPGVDGAELCRRIRSTPDLRSIYMILLTARERRHEGSRPGRGPRRQPEVRVGQPRHRA